MAGTTAKRAPRNRTLTLSAERLAQLRKKLECPETNLSAETMRDRIFCGDFFRLIHLFPAHCADLMVIDPPYNLSKNFHGLNFSRKKDAGYLEYLESWFPGLLRLLKPGGSVYLTGHAEFAVFGCLPEPDRLAARKRTRCGEELEKRL